MSHNFFMMILPYGIFFKGTVIRYTQKEEMAKITFFNTHSYKLGGSRLENLLAFSSPWLLTY